MKLETQADALISNLFPICRSITGEGTRQTLAALQHVTRFDIVEIPSGTKCYDWEVPQEWNIRDAYIEDEKGKRLVDFRDHNLHVVSYSAPVDAVLSYRALRPHLYSLPAFPDAIPYRTSYYKPSWGFCLTHRQLSAMDKQARYRVRIDSSLTSGSLLIGEKVLSGQCPHEFLISTYHCHPSMANDNLSGVVLWTLLLSSLRRRRLKHTYRFVTVPETIGAIAYLARRQQNMKQVVGGFVVTTVGGHGMFGYKETFLGDHLIDHAARHAFTSTRVPFIQYPFVPDGSDERQYSSIAFRIPMGTICKDKYYEYEEYHTSFDNLEFVKAPYIIEALMMYQRAIEYLEHIPCRHLPRARYVPKRSEHSTSPFTYRSLNPHGEPMLGKRGLYPMLGGKINQKAEGVLMYPPDQYAVRWIMFLSDGTNALSDIAHRSGIPLRVLKRTANLLVQHQLLKRLC